MWKPMIGCAVLALAACRGGGEAAPPEHPERLAGEWTVELRLEHPATLTRDPARVAPVRGTVLLLENRRGGVPTHFGVYSADLRPLDTGLRGGVPTLVARLVGRDSVEIAFDPGALHPISGAGALAGDSVAGHWWKEGGRTAGQSSGRFVLRRP